MSDTVTELLPCPLCRSPHVNLARDWSSPHRHVFCKSCGCQAPIAAWNRRPPDAAAELVEALTELVRIRDWVIAAGGTEGPLPQAVIEQFAKMQIPAYDTARALLAKAKP